MAEDSTLSLTLEKENDERSHKELRKPIEFSSFDTREPCAVRSSLTPEHLSYGQGRDGTDSESKEDEDDLSGTSPLSSVNSSQSDSNGKPGIYSTPPRLHLYLQDGDDPVSKKLIEESDADKTHIEESDAELIVSENSSSINPFRIARLTSPMKE